MITNLILFITLLIYSIIVSQSFMYILSLRNAQLGLSYAAYLELRKLIDENMRKKFKYVIYSGLLFNLILVIDTATPSPSFLFIAALIAMAGLIVDTLLTVKGSLPINDVINKWTLNNPPPDWKECRKRWLQIFQNRQIANISGFMSLLTGDIFGL